MTGCPGTDYDSYRKFYAFLGAVTTMRNLKKLDAEKLLEITEPEALYEMAREADTALEAYQRWKYGVLETVFGESKFVELRMDKTSLYGK